MTTNSTPSKELRAGALRAIHDSGARTILGRCSVLALSVLAGQLAAATPSNADPSGADPSMAAATPISDQEYKLGPQDKVRVSVYEWRPALDEIFAWSALNAEYTVGAAGKVSIPLVGEIEAAGKTTAELSGAISARLQERMGLATAPDATVEIIQFRPFYVAGGVEKPGEYPYRPGVTVLQAISISGGLMRGDRDGSNRLQREALATRGEMELYAKERDSLLARQARIEAELHGDNEISFSKELLGRAADSDPATTLLLQQERDVFTARKQAFETQMRVLEELKAYLEKEITSLSGQIEAHRKQMELLRSELEGVQRLAEKGLTTTPRKLALERNFAQMEGDDMRLSGELLKVRQEISRTEISMVELQNKRSGDATTELQTIHNRLEELRSKTRTAGKVLYETEAVAPFRISAMSGPITPVLKIVRRVGKRMLELPATETSLLQPGDTLKVEVPLTEDDTITSSVNTQSGARAQPLSRADARRAALTGSERASD
jgi:polysaccharide export outer membrane protein/exopolysaccharide production protein ExoF